MMNKKGTFAALTAWSLFDFGNSAFSAIIETFVFPAYYVKVIGSAESWGLMIGLTALFIGVTAPFLGARVDQSGGRRGWFILFTLLNVVATGGMGWIYPHSEVAWALLLMAAATIGSEFAVIFYNAMLPDLAQQDQIGRWSSFGWGIGYFGGMLALIIALVLYDMIHEIRWAFIFSATWQLIFALPLFFLSPVKEKVREAVPFLNVLRGPFLRFFLARLFFIDGLLTLFAFGGIYAASRFNMSDERLLLFGIALNISAGVGSFLFARLGPWKTMLFSLCLLIMMTLLALIAQTEKEFWVAGMILGLFVGPLQASSRAYLARLAPPEAMNQMFGFFTFSGKATSFIGPLLISLVIFLTGSITWALLVVIFLFLLGLSFLLSIDKINRKSLS